jgi:SAM-dependent methyltransferase
MTCLPRTGGLPRTGDAPRNEGVPATGAGPRAGDAFGEMLLAELEITQAGGPSVIEIVERDDGFIRGMAASRYLAGPDEWAPFERRALDLAQGRVLDVGCGGGRFALALQERGLAVTGLDVSPGAVEVSRQRGLRDVLVADALDQNALDQNALDQATGSWAHGAASGSYDTFLLMGENLGLLGSRKQAARFLAGLAAAASPGARILGHGADPYPTDDPVHVRYRERQHAAGELGGQMTVRVRYRDLATEWFPYLLCSPDELAGLVAGTSWELTEVDRADPVNYLAVLAHRP